MFNLSEELEAAVERLTGIRNHYEASYPEYKWNVVSSLPHPGDAIRTLNTSLDFLRSTLNAINREEKKIEAQTEKKIENSPVEE